MGVPIVQLLVYVSGLKRNDDRSLQHSERTTTMLARHKTPVIVFRILLTVIRDYLI